MFPCDRASILLGQSIIRSMLLTLIRSLAFTFINYWFSIVLFFSCSLLFSVTQDNTSLPLLSHTPVEFMLNSHKKVVLIFLFAISRTFLRKHDFRGKLSFLKKKWLLGKSRTFLRKSDFFLRIYNFLKSRVFLRKGNFFLRKSDFFLRYYDLFGVKDVLF